MPRVYYLLYDYMYVGYKAAPHKAQQIRPQNGWGKY